MAGGAPFTWPVVIPGSVCRDGARRWSVPFSAQASVQRHFLDAVLDSLAPRRETPPLAERQLMWVRQKKSCANCAIPGKFESLECHHKQRVADGGDGATELLCCSCHSQVTGATAGESGWPLPYSSLNPHTEVNFLRPSFPPLTGVWKSRRRAGDVLWAADISKCRRTAWMHGGPWCVFCPLDSIVPAVDGVVADWTWLEVFRSKGGCVNNDPSMLPYRSPGWYSRACVQFLLSRRKLRWGECLFSFSARKKLPADAFAAGIGRAVAAWDQIDAQEGKRACNAAVGLMKVVGVPRITCFTTRIGFQDQDAWCGGVRCCDVALGDTDLVDRYVSAGQATSRTLAPIREQILQLECLWIAEAM